RVLVGDLFPWSIVLVPAIWFAFKAKESGGETTGASPGIRIPVLYVIWVATIVLFYTLSKSKEDLYIMPAYPAAATLSGGLVYHLLSRSVPSSVGKLSRVTLSAGGFLFAVAGGLGAYIFADRTSPYMLAGASLIGALAIAGGTIAMLSAAVDRLRVSVV